VQGADARDRPLANRHLLGPLPENSAESCAGSIWVRTQMDNNRFLLGVAAMGLRLLYAGTSMQYNVRNSTRFLCTTSPH
jgi:hypothetical protein